MKGIHCRMTLIKNFAFNLFGAFCVFECAYFVIQYDTFIINTCKSVVH